MATNTNPIFLRTIVSPAIQIIDADASAQKTVFSAGVDGGAITNLTATSSDSVDVIIIVSLNDSVQTNIIGEVNVPAGSGTDGTLPAINLLDSTKITLLQNDGSVLLGSGAALEVNAKTTVTAATTIFVTALGGSFSV